MEPWNTEGLEYCNCRFGFRISGFFRHLAFVIGYLGVPDEFDSSL